MNKFITRGISKETGVFVYGYYFYDDVSNSRYIEYVERCETMSFRIKKEITQEPDIYINTKDKNNTDMYTNDIILYKGIKYLIENCKFHFRISPLEKDGWGSCVNDIINDTLSAKLSMYSEVVGNTHFNK